jgi:iron complex transport system ATP-binding protein
MNTLALHNLTVGYRPPRRPAIEVAAGLDATLAPGELVCLIGPNGAGKTTLMRTIAGMQSPLAGRVTLNGDDVHRLPARALAQRLSVVLTDRVDVGLLTAYALVALGRHPYTDWSGRLSAHDEAVTRWALESVGAQALAGRYVSELSDGERQKVMIARALAQEPLLMLLDEPTAFLDLPRRVEIMHLLRHLAHETGRAVLLSTHDLDLALRSADRIWLLPSDGRLQVGAPEDLVLSGAFAAAFRAEGVQFDIQTGAFRVDMPGGGRVVVAGDGAAALWTRRALERAGFITAGNGSAPLAQIEVTGDEDAPRWRVSDADGVREYMTVYEVVQALRMHTRTSPHPALRSY